MKRRKRKKLASAVLTGVLAAAMTATAVPAQVMAAAPEGFSEEQKIQNDRFWEDVEGNTIYSQGGGIFEFDGTYYWYGVKYKNAPNYVDDPTHYYSSGDTYSDFESITCYSSDDLVNWKFEGNIVEEEDVSYREEMEGVKASWVGRLGVAKVGDTYVLVVQHECDDPDNSLDAVPGYKGTSVTDNWSKQVLVLTADSPTGNTSGEDKGKFVWNQRINMIPYTENGTSNTGDQTVFTDPDTGKSYLVYSYGVGRGTIWLSEIVDMGNGLYGPSLEKNYKIYKGAGREGDCMFEYNGDYYLCASDLYGWNASHAYYLRLDSLEEEYLRNWKVSNSMEVMPGCSDDYCHVTQTGFFYTVDGTQQDTVIFCGDRWADFAGNGLGFNQWCPLSFDESGEPYFNSLSSWYLDDETGKWAVAEDNNYAKNGSFDADRVSVTTLTGWDNTVREGNSPIKNSDNRTTGKFGLALTDSVDFDATVSQDITSNDYVSLPDGSYTLTAKVKNSGNFEDLGLFIQSGGLKAKVSIDAANQDWTTVTLSDVAVSGGKAEIGVDAAGAAGAYCYVDDITFVRTGDTAEHAGTVSGTITSDMAGQTVAVEAAQADGNVTYTCEMDLAEGEQNFTLASLPAGAYEITVSGYGCLITPETADVTVEAGATVDNLTFAVENRMGSMQGVVKDNKGNPVEGVKVVLSGGEKDFETVTDGDGSYSFANVAEGEYSLSFEKTGYASVSGVAAVIRTGENTAQAEQILQMNTGALFGKVYDADGNPAAGAAVTLRGSESVADETRLTTVTDERGNYTFSDVVAGTYTLSAYQGKLNDHVNAFAQNVTVVSDEEVGANLDLPQEVAIVNGDFEDGNVNGWESTGSSGRASNDSKHGHVYSGSYGYTTWKGDPFTVELNQTLTGLENGTYVVNVMAAAGTFSDSDELYLYAKNADGDIISRENIPLTVNSGWEMIGLVAEVSDGTLTFGLSGDLPGNAWANFDEFRVGKIANVHEATRNGTISGTVKDADGNPVAGASVMVRGTASVYDTARVSAAADENGNYTVKDVPAGTYTVSASAGDWRTSVNAVTQNVTVERQENTQLELVIPDTVEIVNGGFENGNTEGWSSTGSSGKASNDKGHGHVYSGNYGYTTWKTGDFTVALEQTLDDISNGTYVVNVTATGGTYGEGDELYLYVKNTYGEIIARENIPSTGEDVWELIGLSVDVKDGTLTFGISGDMSGGAWANFDDFRVGQVSVAPVNKEALNTIVAEVEGFDPADCTAASVEAYQAAVAEALEAAKALQADEDAIQKDINAAVKALREAFAAGQENLVTLEAKLAAGIAGGTEDVLAQEEYTAESWAVYAEALAAAQALTGREGLTEAEIDTAVANLQAAAEQLAVKADDTTDLESLIAEIESFDLSAYTAASAVEYTAAVSEKLNAAKELLQNEEAAQKEVDAALEALQAAFADAKAGLVTVESKLAAGIADSIAQVQPEASYTAGSWEAYQAKLAEVRALLNDENLTEEAADAALAELQAAVAGLQAVGSKAELAGLIGEVENFDISSYTDASAAEYQAAVADALTAAKAVMDTPEATQEAIDAVFAELQEAFDTAKSLLKTPAGDPGQPENPDTPGTPSGDEGSGNTQIPGSGSDQNQPSGQNGTQAGGQAAETQGARTADNSGMYRYLILGAAGAAAVCVAACRRKKER